MRDIEEEAFLDGVKNLRNKNEDNCVSILNWYRNLYYKESTNTERYIIADAITDLFSVCSDRGLDVFKISKEINVLWNTCTSSD